MTGKEILQYNKRVEKGIEWLDKNIGRKKWSKKINLNKLDLRGANTCVIGEVLGSYSRLDEKFNVGDSDAEELGFYENYYYSTDDDEQEDEQEDESQSERYAILTAVWINVLKCMKIGVKKITTK